MVFKFSNNFTLDEVKDKRKIKKSKTFSNKVVFVNGFSASGKTMLAPIISSMQNVETIIYPYEIEWLSSFLYTDSIDTQVYQEFIKQYSDHTIYNQMMGRNSNFRYKDVSTVLTKQKFFKYIKRCFTKGDNVIPKKIVRENPSLCFASSHLLFFINEISSALNNRLLFIETVRDPIYMFKQIKVLFEDVYINNKEKLFTFICENQVSQSLFFDYYSGEDAFVKLDKNDLNEICVNYIERIFNFYFNFDFKKLNMENNLFILLPFEKFVTKPDLTIDKILDFLKIKKTKSLQDEMKKQNVPRKLINQGLNRDVYKRYGNEPIPDKDAKNITSSTADENYRYEISKNFKKGEMDDSFKKMIKISDDYKKWVDNFGSYFFN